MGSIGMDGSSTGYVDRGLAFGPFVLMRSRKLLLEGGRPVRLGSRAFEILAALAQRPGELISKEELLACAWPDTVVEENSLRVNIAALRRALGDGQDGVRYILNMSGRGYCFVAPVTYLEHGAPTDFKGRTESSVVIHGLPVRLTRMVGRSEAVALLDRALPQHRLVNIVGPGGVGKTTLALAVAEHRMLSYSHGVRFVDLASLSDPRHLGSALALALGISASASDPTDGLVSFLKPRSILVVLDNCEHLVGMAASWAVTLLRAGPEVHVLATSREPLRAEGEWVHRLPSLGSPPGIGVADASTVIGYPAVQLFAERALASQDDFEVTDLNAPAVGELCRRLDGLPLAIELAAARVAAFGVHELLQRLNDRFLLLSTGYRTALPRHQTLRALLDWSYELLSTSERATFRRLSIFQGRFGLAAASAVAGDDAAPAIDVLADLERLVAKSMIAAGFDDRGGAYHMLETTRSYAQQKLLAAGEKDSVARRLAQHLCDRMAASQADWVRMTRSQWSDLYAHSIEDIRASIAWAFSTTGDPRLGAELAVASQPLANQFSMMDEYCDYLDLAIRETGEGDPATASLSRRLHRALGLLQSQALGNRSAAGSTLRRNLAEHASEDGAHEDIDALMALWVAAFTAADYREALQIGMRIARAARATKDFPATLTADRMLAQARHFLGEHAAAKAVAERVLSSPVRLNQLLLVNSVDVKVSMRIILARISWLEGQPERALSIAMESAQLSRTGVAYALCQALGLAVCPIALWNGDHVAARAAIDELLQHAARHALHYWTAWGAQYADSFVHGALVSYPNDAAQRDMFGTLVPSVVDADMITRIDRGDIGWATPEHLRAHGEGLLAAGRPDTDAEAMFSRSLQIARSQGALSWELRTATSLARLLQRTGRQTQAVALLGATLARFTQGATADLMAARALLAQMGDGA